MSISLTDITIRTTLQPGDIGYITYLHGYLYKKEYNYGIQFESYVAYGQQMSCPLPWPCIAVIVLRLRKKNLPMGLENR